MVHAISCDFPGHQELTGDQFPLIIVRVGRGERAKANGSERVCAAEGVRMEKQKKTQKLVERIRKGRTKSPDFTGGENKCLKVEAERKKLESKFKLRKCRQKKPQ